MNVYRVRVNSAACVPNPEWVEREELIVAYSEDDIRNYFRPAVTGYYGGQHEVIGIDLVGPAYTIISKETKADWCGPESGNEEGL